jgi:preprotein translocase subunit YajC
MRVYRSIAVAGATAAVIIGAGTAALAASGTDSTSGSGTSSTSAGNHAAAKQMRHKRLLTHLVHGQIVTKGKDGYVTHSGVRGTATAVSATSITVKAADGYTQTFRLTKDTKVRERGAGAVKGTPGKVSDLKTGDTVAVLGKAPEKSPTSTTSPTATVVIDGLKK